jgi:hypothetical protein
MTSTRVFTCFTHVADAQDTMHAFGPGDPVPGWAQLVVGDHVWTDVPDAPPGEEPAPDPVQDSPRLPAPSGPDLPAPPDTTNLGAVPPTHGPGSSRPAWEQFAARHHVAVTTAMNRQDIVEACRRAGLLGW